MNRRYTDKIYTNEQIESLIDSHIHNAKYRNILKLRLIDGLTYEMLASEVDMSPRQVKRIVYKAQDLLFRFI